ncbi:hypothetical protein ABPG75_001683 [Micractinium tetrahymenae]
MRGIRAGLAAAAEQTRRGFTSLRGSPRDLYIMFILKVFESYNYFSLSRLFTLYLTEEFGISDYRAGFFYGLWGTLLTSYGFLLGGLIDILGVKGSLVICFLLNISSRLILASTSSKVMLLVMLLGPNTVAGALGVPVMTIGIKRYTHEGNRGFAFALFYSLMNCAALSQGVLMDAFRIGLKHGFNIASLPENSLLNSGSRLFLASGCITSLLGLLFSFALSESSSAAPPPKRTASEAGTPAEGSVHSQRTASSAELELPTSPEAPLLGSSSSVAAASPAARHRLPGSSTAADRPGEEAGGGSGSSAGTGSSGLGRPRQGRTADFWAGVRVVLTSRGFYKYLTMCLFTVNLKSVFRHLDATLPKYQLRAFGCSTPIGLIYSINPAMIVLLVPVVGAMTTDLPHFDMIHYGGWISALSPFFIVAFNTEWSTAAFVALLSLGEAIWSPRWYDYSMSVAPDGREGIFTALASAPLFAAMLPTGMISGALLQTYCPDAGQCSDRRKEDDSKAEAGRRLLALLSGGGGSGGGGGAASGSGGWVRSLAAAAGGEGGAGGEAPAAYCDGRMLWLIVGAITLSSPLLVLLTQRWLRPGPRDFARLGAAKQPTEGECFDVNEADPTGLLENVYESSVLHEAPLPAAAAAMESGAAGARHTGGSRPGSGGGRPGSGSQPGSGGG